MGCKPKRIPSQLSRRRFVTNVAWRNLMKLFLFKMAIHLRLLRSKIREIPTSVAIKCFGRWARYHVIATTYLPTHKFSVQQWCGIYETIEPQTELLEQLVYPFRWKRDEKTGATIKKQTIIVWRDIPNGAMAPINWASQLIFFIQVRSRQVVALTPEMHDRDKLQYRKQFLVTTPNLSRQKALYDYKKDP